MTTKKPNNQINISINVSDDLLNKFMGAMIKMNSLSSMGALPMVMGGMMGQQEELKEEKATIGFNGFKAKHQQKR